MSDVGLTDTISHTNIKKGNYVAQNVDSCITTKEVCNVMLPFLRQTGPCLPRTGIILDEEDMNMFNLSANGNPVEVVASNDKVMEALSLGTLFFGMLSFTDDELFFNLHPNKRAWHIKGQEMYGFEWADLFSKTFALFCAMPSCRYWTYFPHIRGEARGGPAVLPKFVREGLIQEEGDFIRLLSAFHNVTEQGMYSLMCIVCLLEKQMHNRFTERLSYNRDRPQLHPFTVVDFESENSTEGRDEVHSIVGNTSSSRFTDKYIKRCTKEQAVGWQSDLYEDTERSYYIPRLPFSDIEIIIDDTHPHKGGYIVRWRNGDGIP